MSADRKVAVLVGVLYIIGTVALVLSAVVAGEVLTGTATPAQIAAQRDGVAIGALLVLSSALALALVPVVFWPVGRRYDETLAIGFIVFRGAIETALYLVCALGWLVLIAVSGGPDASLLTSFVHTTESVLWDQVLAIPFVLGALMFSSLLYRSRLVPRWLSAWGLVGAVLYVIPAIGSMFGLSLDLLMAPLAVQEMVMAVWLIAKGFSPSATAATASQRSSWQAALPRSVPVT